MANREYITISSSDDEEKPDSKNKVGSSKMTTNFKRSKPTLKKQIVDIAPSNEEIFRQFLDRCKALDHTKDMECVIVKMWKKYHETSPEYVKSAEFKELVNCKMNMLPNTPYVQIKDIKDEFTYHKMKKAKHRIKPQLASASSASTHKSKDEDILEPRVPENELDPKSVHHLKTLKRTLKALSKRIEQLEEAEVNFSDEDDEDSAYIQLCRYKDRFCQIFKKICQLEKTPDHAGRQYLQRIRFSGTAYPVLNRVIEKFYNKTRVFPDFADILNAVKKVNEDEGLKLKPDSIHSIARKAFTELGSHLQKLRECDYYDTFCSYFTTFVDPADEDKELKRKLEENKEKYHNKEHEILEKFVQKQEVCGDEDDTEQNGQSEDDSNEDNEFEDELDEVEDKSENEINDKSDGEMDDEKESDIEEDDGKNEIQESSEGNKILKTVIMDTIEEVSEEEIKDETPNPNKGNDILKSDVTKQRIKTKHEENSNVKIENIKKPIEEDRITTKSVIGHETKDGMEKPNEEIKITETENETVTENDTNIEMEDVMRDLKVVLTNIYNTEMWEKYDCSDHIHKLENDSSKRKLAESERENTEIKKIKLSKSTNNDSNSGEISDSKEQIKSVNDCKELIINLDETNEISSNENAVSQLKNNADENLKLSNDKKCNSKDVKVCKEDSEENTNSLNTCAKKNTEKNKQTKPVEEITILDDCLETGKLKPISELPKNDDITIIHENIKNRSIDNNDNKNIKSNVSNGNNMELQVYGKTNNIIDVDKINNSDKDVIDVDKVSSHVEKSSIKPFNLNQLVRNMDFNKSFKLNAETNTARSSQESSKEQLQKLVMQAAKLNTYSNSNAVKSMALQNSVVKKQVPVTRQTPFSITTTPFRPQATSTPISRMPNSQRYPSYQNINRMQMVCGQSSQITSTVTKRQQVQSITTTSMSSQQLSANRGRMYHGMQSKQTITIVERVVTNQSEYVSRQYPSRTANRNVYPPTNKQSGTSNNNRNITAAQRNTNALLQKGFKPDDIITLD